MSTGAAIPDQAVPHALEPAFQHALATYASETSKLVSVWGRFTDADLEWRPDAKSFSVKDVLEHQLLSERRFFGGFLGSPEPAPAAVLPEQLTVGSCQARAVELARKRLDYLALQPLQWWLETVPFFDVHRQRVWIFWRRVLHTAHHRTQLTMYLRRMGRPVPSTYGPTADETWEGADPTTTVEAAGRG
ncbi:MAG: DinB family protein [Bryobacteraceae bacterium]|nr:DinB family protein [Bryobacteraceae bacterium]